MDKQAEMVELLSDMKKLFAEQRSLLQSIKNNTATPEDQKS
jgi:t-SNARE complex subunit (syntaxin)